MRALQKLTGILCGGFALYGCIFLTGCEPEKKEPPTLEAKMLMDSMDNLDGWEYVGIVPVYDGCGWDRKEVICSWNLSADVCANGRVYRINSGYKEIYPFSDDDRKLIAEAFKRAIYRLKMKPIVDGAMKAKEVR